MNIEYLYLESEAISRSLQGLLDRQSDGLMRRNKRLLATSRHGIGASMRQLAEIKNRMASFYSKEMTRHKEWLDDVTSVRVKVEELDKHIRTIETESEESGQISKLEADIVDFDNKIKSLENQLAELRGQKNDVLGQLSLLRSTVASKCSSYQHELETLESRQSTDVEIETCSREIDALRDRFNDADLETCALRDGITVWKDSCNVVEELEQKLADIPSTERQRPDKIVRMLESALSRLERNLNIAEANKWSLLSVAIGQELEALKLGLDIINRQVISEPNSSPSVMESSSGSSSPIGLGDGRRKLS
jgi:chromosome segregation ATPase